MPLEYVLLVGSMLVLVSIAIVKLTERVGVPTLLLFLAIGMLAGSEGPGGIFFDNAKAAQWIGIIALVFILFAGGMDTDWHEVRPVLFHAAALAIPGVLVTAACVGLFASFVFDIPLQSAYLLGAVISSTDAAAVFAVLRAKNLTLPPRIRSLLELESGSNDPMAVFLTIGLIQYITHMREDPVSFTIFFLWQMGIGAAFGYALGRVMILVNNRLKLEQEGMYPVFFIAFISLIYGVSTSLGGSGFLAVYIAGLIAGAHGFTMKKNLIRFFDGMAWLSQIAMFITLGLLVFPSHIVPVIGSGLLVSIFLMMVARPLSVFIVLAPSSFHWKEKAFVSWVGLRGAVPIVLATFPLLARLPHADLIFNVVFFTVFTSAILQGWTLPYAARVLLNNDDAASKG
ncbi:MAG TPA: potassium/proton antiporter [Bacteroidota bacterium]|nr:potassium/proton antiporter [Bacteroidota bacterium]